MIYIGVLYPAMLCFLVAAVSCKPVGDRSEVATARVGEGALNNAITQFDNPHPSFVNYVSEALNKEIFSREDLNQAATNLSNTDTTLQSFALNSQKVQHAICLSSNIIVGDRGVELGLCKRVNAPGFVMVEFGTTLKLKPVQRGAIWAGKLVWLRWVPETDEFTYSKCSGFDATLMGGISHIRCSNKDKDGTWAEIGGAVAGFGWAGSAGQKINNGENFQMKIFRY